MNETEDPIIINKDICLLRNPQFGAPGLLSFAIWNDEGTDVKFLRWSDVYEWKQIKKFQHNDMIFTEDDSGVRFIVSNIMTFKRWNGGHSNDIISDTYNYNDLLKIKNILAPLIFKGGKGACKLSECLKVEEEFIKFQREVLKEIEESNLPRTESFYNFGKNSKKDLGQEKE